MADSSPPSPDPERDTLALQKRIVLGSILVILAAVGLLSLVVPSVEDAPGSAADAEASAAAPGETRSSSGRRAKQRADLRDPRSLDPGSKREPRRKVRTRADAPDAPAPLRREAAQPEEGVEFEVHAPDGEGIRAAVDERVDEIRHCYEQWLKWKPTIEGKLVVSFKIEVPDDEDPVLGPDGEALAAITEVELAEDEVGHLWMEGCVLGVFETLRFHRPADGPLVVNYPLRFEPE